jgi:hypothetical protein
VAAGAGRLWALPPARRTLRKVERPDEVVIHGAASSSWAAQITGALLALEAITDLRAAPDSDVLAAQRRLIAERMPEQHLLRT